MSIEGGSAMGGAAAAVGPMGGPIGGGAVAPTPAAPGMPMLRWSSRARSLDGVSKELGRIWDSISLTTIGETGDAERRIAARSSVMNLVVVAGRGEVGERAASIVEGLTGRHPSRTLIVTPADPDGPPWIDAQVQAHCVMPSATAPETCSELVYMTLGGESGQHLVGIVAPLLIHDLPVTLWWPGEPHFESSTSHDLLDLADRVLVDGSGWSGDGLPGLASLAALPHEFHVEISDFALLRQARWREAIASTFDRPSLLPFLTHLERIEVRYAAADGAPGMANVVRPIYHVAWLASRLDMTIVERIHRLQGAWSGYEGVLRSGSRRVPVTLRPMESDAPRGTTLAVELYARKGRSELVIEVTAYADGVLVHASLDDVQMPQRRFVAPRKREADLLAETIDAAGRDPLSAEILAMAADLVEAA
ncbi:MAG TPA: glucose-6-phosphate dehydrogenase assembly protein OpcA [Candidatus Limnocylindria bacterium]|nr:glucose-6-phosphate dehydrogenase assembly protein OpcA [Candidatus Limnocylindria bacterium]